ncbi:MAG: response regulator [Chitinophagales bacterium]|nr:response regulator [Chitinophagales bacterium]
MDKPLNILLIEDNPGDAFLIKFYLEESVFKTARLIHAEFLKTALDLLSKNAFDVILLDLNLPDSRDLATLEEILTVASNTVVIVLTGLNDEELGVKTVKMGAQDFLVKGQFDGKVLTSSVRYAFERYQLQKKVDNFTSRLDEGKQRMETIETLAQIGYWELNVADSSMYWSPGFMELVGGQELNKIPHNLHTFIETLDCKDEDLQKHFMKTIEHGEPVDCQFLLQGKPDLRFHCKSRPMHDTDGKLAKIGGVIQRMG